MGKEFVVNSLEDMCALMCDNNTERLEGMKVGDVYYEKHTVVGISTRNGTVSETDVEIVNVLPIDVLDKIKADVERIEVWECSSDGHSAIIRSGEHIKNIVIEIIDKYKSDMVK